MIESIEFVNFKALRHATLPLGPFTLLMGPNGSGKSSVLQAIQGIAQIAEAYDSGFAVSSVLQVDHPIWRPTANAMSVDSLVEIKVRYRAKNQPHTLDLQWDNAGRLSAKFNDPSQLGLMAFNSQLSKMRVFALNAPMIASPAPVTSAPLDSSGAGLPAVLDEIKDNHPERWELLLKELREWLPEYDHIQFIKPEPGKKAVALRTRRGGYQIPATDLSQGSLIALALLTLAYQPNPPSVIGIEEIDRGLHPRLLRHLQDALYRLSYPEACGEKRPPIQVIATTHSPYLLDLYREHPEEVVLAEKQGLEVQFRRLSDIEHYKDILGDSPLSEVWYSGVLGGVSVKP